MHDAFATGLYQLLLAMTQTRWEFVAAALALLVVVALAVSQRTVPTRYGFVCTTGQKSLPADTPRC